MGTLLNRQKDNWRPLFSIAHVAGGDWPARAAAAAHAASPSGGDQSRGAELLTDIRELFAEERTDKLRSAVIVERLIAMEDRPWAEYRKGKGISQNGLASALKPYGISSITIRPGSGKTDTGKGYYLRSFGDAFERYLPRDANVERHTVTTEAAPGFSEDDQPSQAESPLRLETPEKPIVPAVCDGVTDEIPRAGERTRRAEP